MLVTIRISTDSAAFADDPGREVARILTKLAERLTEAGLHDAGPVRLLLDANGGTAGRVTVTA